MPNENCLAGFRCPECDNEDEFRIAVTAWAKVTDDGVEDYDDTEWDDYSACMCPACGFTAKVMDFAKPDDEPRP